MSRTLRALLSMWILPLGLIILGAAASTAVIRYAEDGTIDLDIDAQISKGSEFELYANRDFHSPWVVPVLPQARHTYSFLKIPGSITSLRLHPSNQGGASFTIYSLRFKHNNNVLKTIAGEELKDWALLYGIPDEKAPQGAFGLIANDASMPPFMEKDITLTLTDKLIGMAPRPFVEKFLFWILSCSMLLYVIVLSKGRNFTSIISAIVGVVISFYAFDFVVRYVLSLGSDIPAVDQAVGYASYWGIQKASEYGAYRWGVAALAACALVLGLLWQLIRHRGKASVSMTLPHERLPSFPFLAFTIIAIAILSFPNFAELMERFRHVVHRTDYDSTNFLSWHYALLKGLIPFRDLWYPYGGFYYLGIGGAVPSLRANLLAWLHELLLASILIVCLYRVFRSSKAWTLGTLITLTLMRLMGVIEAGERYFLSITIVLAFALCLEYGALHLFILFGFYSFYVFFMESAQLLYAAPSCALLLVLSLWCVRGRHGPWPLILKTAFSGLIVTGLTALYLWRLHEKGAFHEYFLFYQHAKDLATFTALPSWIESWIAIPSTIEQWSICLQISLLTLSLWYWMSLHKEERRVFDAVPFALAIVSAFFFQKQILRAHMGFQLFSPLMLGLIILINRYAQRFPPSLGARAALALSAGLSWQLLCVGASTSLEATAGKIPSLALAFPASVRNVLGERDTWKSLKEGFFEPRTFDVEGTPGEEFKNALLSRMTAPGDRKIYVLGDDSFLYPLLNQKIPFHTSLYPQSILYAQDETADNLERHPPQYVIWKSNFRDFDSVPNIVRTPLIYQYVIEHFTFQSSLGSYVILRPLAPGEKPDLEYWSSVLGTSLNFGFIPSRSKIGSLKQDPRGNKLPFLSLRIQNPAQGQEAVIAFDVGGKPFQVRLTQRDGVKEYYLNLKRVWFWQASKKAGIMPQLLTESRDGFKISLGERLSKERILY